LLYYPDEMKAVDPNNVIPHTWQATSRGGYIFRNRWTNTPQDIVAQIYAKDMPGGGWSRPNAGDIRIWGLGHAWAIQSPLNSKGGSRWYANVVKLPDDPINEDLGGERIYSEARTDGSGVVSLDMRRVYATSSSTWCARRRPSN
jgi:hypothetical protein